MTAHDVEKQALVLDRTAVIRVVSALRQYRQAAVLLLGKRYADGEVDAVALHVFKAEVNNAEEVLLEGEDG
jgi:hypothetical protein